MPSQYADDARLASIVEPFMDVLPGPINHGDIVLSSPSISLPVGAHSGTLIAPPLRLPAPLLGLDDVKAARMIESELLSSDLSQRDRIELLRRHGVQWIVLTPNDAERLGSGEYSEFDEVLRTRNIVVYRVDDTG